MKIHKNASVLAYDVSSLPVLLYPSLCTVFTPRHKGHYQLLFLFISCHYYVLQIQTVQIRNFLVKSDQCPEESFRIYRYGSKTRSHLFGIKICMIFANLYFKIVQFVFYYISMLLMSFCSSKMGAQKLCQLFTWPSLRVRSGSVRKDLESRIRIRTKSFRIPNAATIAIYRYMHTGLLHVYSKLLVSYILFSYI